MCEPRRHHPKWGSRRIAFELGRHGCSGPVPSRMTVYRILIRHGLMTPAKRRRGCKDYIRWERDRPMELWRMDIVGGIFLSDGSEAEVVTGVDDQSRYCVIASVAQRATGRAVCLAFASALLEFGVPEEVLTDNGKQFTARFGNGGEVMFDRICRENGIVHRLTQPATPTTTGKVERFHQTLRRELLDDVPVWSDIATAQAAIDAFRADYNTDRPHQSLDMAFPADRFRAADPPVVPVKLPATLTVPVEPPAPLTPMVLTAPPITEWPGSAVEFDRVVPPSGNLQVAGKQFWLGPNRSGVTVTFLGGPGCDPPADCRRPGQDRTMVRQRPFTSSAMTRSCLRGDVDVRRMSFSRWALRLPQAVAIVRPGMGSASAARQAGAPNGSAKYCVSWVTWPAANCMMLTE